MVAGESRGVRDGAHGHEHFEFVYHDAQPVDVLQEAMNMMMDAMSARADMKRVIPPMRSWL